MEQTIVRKLREIEKNEHVRILLAVESGSRAWGFPSTDSDYDVRFIYIRQKEDYLRLEKTRDVIELPLDDVLDINGWDLQKTLRLFRKSNPTLFEWFSSPIVYMETPFAETFRAMMGNYFSTKRSLYHYIHMAEKNKREYLEGDLVKVKKYYYVLRPVLACRWILEKKTPPPMLFSELMEAELPDALRADVNRLLDLKQNSPEVKMTAKVDTINTYLEDSIADIQNILKSLEETNPADWQELDDLFLQQLQTM